MQVVRSGAYGEVMEHTSLTPAVVPEEPAVARTLLEDCLAFIAETGMSETYFGRLSCGNSELLKRMRRPGGERRISVYTDKQVRGFIAERRAHLAAVAAELQAGKTEGEAV